MYMPVCNETDAHMHGIHCQMDQYVTYSLKIPWRLLMLMTNIYVTRQDQIRITLNQSKSNF